MKKAEIAKLVMDVKGVHRIPVRHRNGRKWLSPCRMDRAKELLAKGDAAWFTHKTLGSCIRMKRLAKGNYIDFDYVLGHDPGSRWDGYTVLGRDCQFNFEYEFSRLLRDKDAIRKLSERRRTVRRTRRGRLRHRPARFSNRTGSKWSNTAWYYFQHRRNMIRLLLDVFHCSAVVMEDVRFNHAANRYGRHFSPCEIGKNALRDFVRSRGIEPMLVEGWQTAKRREEYFGGKDPKSSNKADKSFFAHCIDSFILSLFARPDFVLHTTRMSYISRPTEVEFVRRYLYQFKKRYKDRKYYFRYGKGGRIIVFRHMSRLAKLRVKRTDTQKSNHGPFDYMYTQQEETFRMFLKRYGGTVIRGCSMTKGEQGRSKYWDGRQYVYHKVERI